MKRTSRSGMLPMDMRILRRLFFPNIKFLLLPGGVMPIRKTSGAVGYDVGIRAVVSKTEREPGAPHLRKTLFDFTSRPKDATLCKFVRKSKEAGGAELEFELWPGYEALIGIGFIVEMPPQLFYTVSPRSGLVTLKGLENPNDTAPVDSDYRGEAGILLRNKGEETITLRRGMRVAQMVFHPAITPVFSQVQSLGELSKTQRGYAGFGSTGVYK